MIRLSISAPGHETRELLLSDPVIGIGRDPTNLVIVDDKRSSRYHCQIERDDEGWKIVDNASANGTVVNDQVINFRRLVVGDTIAIGQTAIKVVEIGVGRASRRTRPAGPSFVPEESLAERRGRRRAVRSGSSSQLVAWLLAGVVVIVGGVLIINSQMALKFQRNSLRAAELALEEDDFEKALNYASNIGPSSRLYSQALALRDEVSRRKKAFQEKSLDIRAGAAFNQLSQWTRAPGIDRASMQGHIDFFLSRYGDSSYASRARELIDQVPDTASDTGVSPRRDPSEEPPTKRETTYEALSRRVDGYVSRKQFGVAIEELRDYWSDNTGKDAESANARIQEVRAAADKAWGEIKDAAVALAKAGEKTKALALLWDAEGFGIESIREAANKLAAEIGK